MHRSADKISSLRGTGNADIDRRDVLAFLAAMSSGALLPRTSFAQSAPRRGGILRISAPANPSSLDPMNGVSGYDHSILYTIYDTLIEFDYDTIQPKPGIAKAWRYSDPKTLVLDLNENVFFHDGAPCDGPAVKANLDRALTDPRSGLKSDLGSVASVDVTGPLQVSINLKYPDSALVLILSDRAGMMVSPKAAQIAGAEFDRKPVGAGPYVFNGWVSNSKVSVKRNEKYWRPNRPYPDGIEFAIIPELNTGLRSVVAGENDLVYSLSRQQKIVADRAKLESISGPTQIIHTLHLNFSRPPFNDVRIRQAFNYAVDREAFNKVTQDGEPTRAMLPKEHWACNPALASAYPYDPDKARKLLAEAGVPNGYELNAGGWNDQKAIQRQEILIEQFSKVGIKTKFTPASVADGTTVFFMQEKRGDAYLGTFTGRPDPSLALQRLYDPTSVLNAGRADPLPERQPLQLESQASQDLETRKRALFKLQQLVSDNALSVPIVVQYDMAVFGAKVKGYRPNLTGKPKFDDVFLEG